MDKLQYDSFYKFLVSAGVVLITGPILGLYYLLCNGNQILLSQTDYSALNSTSQIFVLHRDSTILTLLRFLPWIMLFLIFTGLFFLIFGGIKWYNIQKELDEQTKLKTQEQKVNVQKLTASEVVEKVVEEIASERESSIQDSPSHSMENNKIVKAMRIEDLCFSYVSKKDQRNFSYQQNVRINSFVYDIIATHKYNSFDFLYEVKYWSSIPPLSIWNNLLKRVESAGIAYENNLHRNFKFIILIVTPNECFKKISTIIESRKVNLSSFISIKALNEDELR